MSSPKDSFEEQMWNIQKQKQTIELKKAIPWQPQEKKGHNVYPISTKKEVRSKNA